MPKIGDLPVQSPSTVTALKSVTGVDELTTWQEEFGATIGAADGQSIAQEILNQIGDAEAAASSVSSGLANVETELGDKASIEGTETFAVAGGTVNALTATFNPAITAPVDGEEIRIRASGANTSQAVTLAINGQVAQAITKLGGDSLDTADIAGPGHELVLRYVQASNRWELLNPAQTALAWIYPPSNASPGVSTHITTSSLMLTGSAYHALYGISQDRREFQVDYAGNDFSSPQITATTYPSTAGADDALSARVSGYGINSHYIWRYRDVNTAGNYGDWSAPTDFFTPASFNLSGTYDLLSGGPPARRSATMVSINGKFYLFGGLLSSTSAVANDLWEYDVAGDLWTQKTSGSTARSGHTAVVISGVMYVFGGTDSTNNPLNDIWSYNPATDTWAQVTPQADSLMPPARTEHAAFSINGYMYVFGGSGSSLLNDLWRYSPSTGYWGKPANLNGPSARNLTGYTAIGNIFYIFGGTSGSLPELWSYDTSSSNWYRKPDNNVGLYAAALVASGPNLYLFGGNNYGTLVNTLREYNVSLASWSSLASGMTARELMASTQGDDGDLYIFGGLLSDGSFGSDLWRIS